MATMRCNSCRGEYPDNLPDGTLYFHACPPFSEAEVIPQAVLAAADVLRAAGKPDAEIRAVITSAPEFQQVGKPRPDARNENVFQREPFGKAEILAQGKGRTEV